MTEQQHHADGEVTRPIVGIENRTAQEVFDIMSDRFRRALVARPAAPEGEWVVVPREPTNEMFEAMYTAMFSDTFTGAELPMLGAGWDAMLAVTLSAAPKPEPASAVQVTEVARTLVGDAWESYSHDGSVYCVPASSFEALAAALSQSQPAPQHSDDLAVDRFAAVMKAKLEWEREECNRSGWQNMSAENLSRLLYEHLPKGDPIDVANLSMMLHQNGQRIVTDPAPQPATDYDSDVTPEAVQIMREKAAPYLDEAGVEEPEVVAWRYCNHDIDGAPWPWTYTEGEPSPDHAEIEPLIRLSDHNTIVDRLKERVEEAWRARHSWFYACGKANRARYDAENALTVEREASARLREALEGVVDRWDRETCTHEETRPYAANAPNSVCCL